jgi:hypothetical protein
MGKFGGRSLAQPSAWELTPQGVHATHFVFDEGIRAADAEPDNDEQLDPNAIAQSYMQLHPQHRRAWAWEVESRPWVEHF